MSPHAKDHSDVRAMGSYVFRIPGHVGVGEHHGRGVARDQQAHDVEEIVAHLFMFGGWQENILLLGMQDIVQRERDAVPIFFAIGQRHHHIAPAIAERIEHFLWRQLVERFFR